MQIEAADNPLIKRLRLLADRKSRDDQGLFLVEGRRAIDGFLQAGWLPKHLLLRQGEPLPPGWPEAITVSARAMQRVSLATTASGYLATFAIPSPPAVDLTAGGLVLAEVADPGNAGTLIRTAAAFAIRQVILIGGADPWSPKVVQASAGSFPQVTIHRLDPAHGLAPLAGGAPLTALVVRDGAAPTALLRGPRFLVIGGEAHGVPAAWLASCNERLTLPMPGGTESLNAAVAGSIAAYAVFIAR